MKQIQIIGNLGGNAEVKKIGENDYASFSIAITEKIKGEDVTTWFSCLKYGTNEKLLPHLVKGTKVFVQGNLSAKISESNEKTYLNLSINVDKLELISKPAEVAQVVEASPAPQSTSSYMMPESTPLTSDNDSSLPF